MTLSEPATLAEIELPKLLLIHSSLRIVCTRKRPNPKKEQKDAICYLLLVITRHINDRHANPEDALII